MFLLLLSACEPEIKDFDGDGVQDHIEDELGTDPFVRDSDGDGFDDGVEYDAGTDGTLCWSVPEGLPQCEWQAEQNLVVGEGWDIGQVIPDPGMTGTDGVKLSLRQFYTTAMVVNVTAAWCGPCMAANPDLEAFHQAHVDEGFWMIQTLVEGTEQGVNADSQACIDWAEQESLSFPVTWNESYESDGEAINAFYARLYLAGHDVTLPFYVVLDRNSVITEVTGDWELAQTAAEAAIASEVVYPVEE